MTNNQLRPQKAKKGSPAKVSENKSSGGGTYDQSAGPTSTPGNPVPGKTPATQAKRVGKPGASDSSPDSKRPPKAPSTGDRGVA